MWQLITESKLSKIDSVEAGRWGLTCTSAGIIYFKIFGYVCSRCCSIAPDKYRTQNQMVKEGLGFPAVK
jgi:hypothetical protein